ncbi:hypothetical protein VP14_219 [Vibrio phage VPMCC14]|nr:hypothetical protein VP14_219 [Vibrio phage VPMCC14]
MFSSCKHKWEVLQDITTESHSELHTRVTGRILTPDNIGSARKLFSRKHITILSCSECGKIKRYVENI